MAEIYTLGAGTPTPTPTRFGSSHVLKLGDQLLMFDCGPAATHKLVKAGLFPTQVDYLFFTHHHFDHDIDYPCFLLCRWDQSIGKENQLQVFGPDLTEKITEGILGENGLFAHDWKARDIGPGKVFSGSDWEVTAATAEHVQPWLDSLAYRVDSVEGSIVFTGDTQPCDSVTQLARGADMMLCMCWDEQAVMDANGEYIGQCGTTGAARMAQAAGVGETGSRSHRPPPLSPRSHGAWHWRDQPDLQRRDSIFRRTDANSVVRSTGTADPS